MSAFWYRLIPAWAPSWLVELVSGLLTVALAYGILVLPRPIALGLVATALSVVYESRFDPNGWELWDVLEREVGIIIGSVLVLVAHL